MKQLSVVGGVLVVLFSTAVFAQQPEQNPEEDTFCPEVYTPVCGLVEVECVTAPCDSVPETFSNSCFLQQNERASYLYEGECADTRVAVAEEVHTQIADLSVVDPVLGGSWYVVQIEFIGTDRMLVTYEDGHIQEDMTLSYTVNAEGEVDFTVEEAGGPTTVDESEDETQEPLPTEDAIPDSPANEGGIVDETTTEQKPRWSCFGRWWNNLLTWLQQR